MKKRHLVVDGSNIATEGRPLPSLAQLEEAVEAFLGEHKFEYVTVVVDATFGHRISAKERRWYEDAVASNRIITPPAGAIGRGDAFILEIARRAGATILSNDSFQEFHGTNDWLFDDGRLFGGKPVPHVGWVFVPRSPVRGPTSRRAVKKARTANQIDVGSATLVETAESARSGARARKNREAVSAPDGHTKSTTAETRAVTQRASSDAATARSSRRGDGARKSAAAADGAAAAPASPRRSSTRAHFNEPDAYERFRIAHPVGSLIEVVIDRFSSHGAYAHSDNVEVYIPTKLLGDPPPQRARDVLALGELVGLIVHRYDDATRGIDARAIRIEDDITYYAAARASTAMVESTQNAIDADASRQGSEQPTRRSELVATKKKAAAKKAPAKRKAAKKAPAKKAAAKKAPAKRKATKKASAATKAPAKRKAAKKTTAKRKAAKKAPAKRKATKRTAKKK